MTLIYLKSKRKQSNSSITGHIVVSPLSFFLLKQILLKNSEGKHAYQDSGWQKMHQNKRKRMSSKLT